MFICSCEVVNDRTILAVIAAGARTVEEVGAACRAGTNCGDCRPSIQQLLDSAFTLRPGSTTTPPDDRVARSQPQEAST